MKVLKGFTQELLDLHDHFH